MINENDPELCTFERAIARNLGIEDLDTLIGKTFTFVSEDRSERDLVCTVTAILFEPVADISIDSQFECMLRVDTERELTFTNYGTNVWTLTEDPDTDEETVRKGTIQLW